MLKKMWLPAIATAFLVSLVFIENIPVQSSDAYHTDQEEVMLNLLAGKYSIDMKNGDEVNKEESFLRDFDKFLNKLGHSPFRNEVITFADTTGDGLNEKIRYAYRIEGDQCIVEQEIYKENERLWHQSFVLKGNHVNMYFNQSNVGQELTKYALYYIAGFLSPFTDKLEINSAFFDRSKKLALNAPENDGMSPIEAYNSDLMKEIESYQGMYVFKREPGHEAIFMWDKNLNTFKKIYSLQSYSV